MLWTAFARWVLDDGSVEHEELDVDADTYDEAKREAERRLAAEYIEGGTIVAVTPSRFSAYTLR